MPALPKPETDAEKIKPTPAWVMTILILILIGLVITTVKVTLYPSPPATWKQLYEKPNLPMADVNRILSESHAIMESVKATADGSIETWQLKHRTGMWFLTVNLKKSPAGVVFDTAQVKCDITNLPSFARSWEYPEKAK